MFNIPKYDPSDLTADIVLKHFAYLNGKIIEDITTAVQLAFEDGFCRGFNEVNKWWEPMNDDLAYIKSFDNSVEGSGYIDEVYGDVPNIQDLEAYDDLFNRRNKNE